MFQPRAWIVCSLMLLLVVALVAVPAVLADAAPPEAPDGENIDPGKSTTMVQMVAEEVVVDVGATLDSYLFDDGYGEWAVNGYRLAYNCTFWMVNQGVVIENLAVRFPINTQWEYGGITIQSIKVDGDPVSWWEDEIDVSQPFSWAHFDVTFPPGEEVEIKVTYTSLTKPQKGFAYEWVSYILETGAGWYGPIGQGRIILRLPYAPTTENVLLELSSPDAEFNGSDLVWEFTDLEPTSEDNWRAWIVNPDTWLAIESNREKLESSPNNSAALARLSELIYPVCVEEREQKVWYQEEMFEEGFEAIEKAVGFLPEDLDLRGLFIRYLIADLDDERYAILQDQLAYVTSVDPENPALTWPDYSAGYWEYMSTKQAVEAQPSPVTPIPATVPVPTNTPPPVVQPTHPPKPIEDDDVIPAVEIPPEEESGMPVLSIALLVGGLAFGAVILLGVVVLVIILRGKR